MSRVIILLVAIQLSLVTKGQGQNALYFGDTDFFTSNKSTDELAADIFKEITMIRNGIEFQILSFNLSISPKRDSMYRWSYSGNFISPNDTITNLINSSESLLIYIDNIFVQSIEGKKVIPGMTFLVRRYKP